VVHTALFKAWAVFIRFHLFFLLSPTKKPSSRG